MKSKEIIFHVRIDDSPSNETLPTSTKKKYNKNYSIKQNGSYVKSKGVTQRDSYSTELDHFIDCTLKKLAEKIQYKKLLENEVANNFRHCKVLNKDMEQLKKEEDYLNIKLGNEVGEIDILERKKSELEGLLFAFEEKTNAVTHKIDYDIAKFNNRSEKVNNQTMLLIERLKKLEKEKEQERIQLKKDINSLKIEHTNINKELNFTNKEITKSKNSEYNHLRKVRDESNVLTTLTEKETVPIKDSIRKQDLIKVMKSVKIGRAHV